MSSEQRLYTFTPETKATLRKFRLGTSRADTMKAMICQIDKSILQITPLPGIHTTLTSLSDALPDNAPRFILLSYPLTQASGRLAVPYVLVAYMPTTTSSEQRMLYAGAKELLRKEAETGRLVDVEDAEEVEGLEAVLRGEE